MNKKQEKFTKNKLAHLITTLTLANLCSSVVNAQDIDTDNHFSAIEEITVTARRRAESLQDIPISITAFSASDIDQLGITDISHISELTPNLIIQPNTGGNDGTLVCMRGLCRTDFTITEDPMVGVYLDGVYIGKSIGSLFDIAELERVEVLRGPQGTLYGKNTLGGAVLLHTRKPTGELGGRATVTAGNFGRLNTKGYIEMPVSDQLAASISFLTKNRDPYVKNTLGDDRWDEDNKALHGAIHWSPSDQLTMDYAFDWQEKREQPLSPQIVSATGFGGVFDQDIRPNREDQVHTFGASQNDTDLNGHSLTLAYDLGDDLLFKSITGYRESKNNLLNNAAGASTALIYNHDIFELDSLSQEFQLSGSAFDGFTDFVVGVFYFNEEGDYSNKQRIDIFGANLLYETGIDNTSLAAFGEVTFNFTDQLAASIGLRYTDEERKQSHQVTDLLSGFTFLDTDAQTFGGFPQQYPPKVNETSVSPRLSLNYQWNNDLMTYVTYARGFKSGGFNARSTTPLQWGPYGDMQVDSYEIGIKSNWMDNRVKLNLTAFSEDLTDMQAQVNAVDPLSSQGGFSTVIQNAGEATIAGLETEIILRLIPGLDISAGYGYTDAEYDEFDSFDLLSGQISDISADRAFEFTPKNSYNLSLNYTFPQFTDNGTLTARLDWSGQSKIRFIAKVSDNDDISQESYDLLNARVSYDDLSIGDGSLSVSLWIKNLTDEEYKIGGYEVPAGAFGRVGINQWGEPRTYGVDISYRFGSMK